MLLALLPPPLCYPQLPPFSPVVIQLCTTALRELMSLLIRLFSPFLLLPLFVWWKLNGSTAFWVSLYWWRPGKFVLKMNTSGTPRTSAAAFLIPNSSSKKCWFVYNTAFSGYQVFSSLFGKKHQQWMHHCLKLRSWKTSSLPRKAADKLEKTAFSFLAGVPSSQYTENVGPNPGQDCFNFNTGTVPLLPGK